MGAYRLIAKYLIEQWLTKIAFEELVEHGLEKTYYIQTNALQNLKLMSNVVNKLFRLEEIIFENEFMHPFNKLFESKKSRIIDFYRELVEIPQCQTIVPEFEHHSMCLTVAAVQ